MNESELQAGIVEAAYAAGWLIHHDRPAMRADGTYTTAIEGHAGFPDLVLVHPRHLEIVVAELKGDRGRVSAVQRQWLDAFDQAGIPTRLWTPDNYEHALFEITNATVTRAVNHSTPS